MSSTKILSLEEAREKINGEKKRGKRVAMANGCFDIIHIGHIRYLEGAGKLADILLVAVNSDRSLRYLKGRHRGFIDENGRARIVAAFACVDYVLLFDEPTVDKILITIQPDYHCKGSDYHADTVPERETVASYGGRTAIVGGDKVRSSSEIISAIRQSDPAAAAGTLRLFRKPS